MKLRSCDVEVLRLHLSYEPETGVIRWVVPTARAIKAGQRAGRLTDEGYRLVRLLGVDYFAHRIAWALMHGSWPSLIIDHKNGGRDDNRSCNIREVSLAMNQQNRTRAQAGSKTGFIGVQARPNGTFQAKIRNEGRRIALGTYATPEEAHGAYIVAKSKMHPGYVA